MTFRAPIFTVIALVALAAGCGSDDAPDAAGGSGGSAGGGSSAGSGSSSNAGGGAGAGGTTGGAGGAGGVTTGGSAGGGGTGGSGGTTPLPDCTKYVAKSGSVNGKPAAKTIQAGVDGLVAGDTLCVAPGTYHELVSVKKEQSGTEAKPTTVRALDPANKPLIDGEYTLPEGKPMQWKGMEGCKEVWEDPTANQGPPPKTACAVWQYMLTITADHFVWDGIDITRSRGQGVLMGNWDGPPSAVQDVELRNSEISNIRVEGVYIAGIKGARFRGNRVHDSIDYAAYSRSASVSTWSGGIYDRRSEDVEILDNEIFHNWGEGIGTGLVENVDATVPEDIIKNVRVAGNILWDNMSGQLYVSDKGSNIIVEKNVVYHTGDPKYFLNAPGWTSCISVASEKGQKIDDVLIADNIVRGCAGLITFGQFKPGTFIFNVRIENNTVFGGGHVLRAGSTNLTAFSGMTIANNIFLGQNGGPLVLPAVPGLKVSNNLWSSTPPSHLSGPGDVIATDPGFATPNYKPQPGAFDPGAIKLVASSPAVNAGASIAEVKDDFFGTPRPVGGGFDIGAHELK